MLEDADMLCEQCKKSGLAPRQLSEGLLKTTFKKDDEPRILSSSLQELGIPPAHLVAFENEDENKPMLIIELSEDIRQILPHLPT